MFEGLSEQDLLKAAVTLVEETITHDRDSYKVMATAHDYYNGNQWEQGDIDYMREQNREPLTFNICKVYVDDHVGSDDDMRREPRITAVNTPDAFSARIWDHILQRVYYDTRIENTDLQVDEDRTIGGLGFTQIVADIMPKRPDRIRVRVVPLNPFDVHTDFTSQNPDLSDAEYVFHAKWLTRREFREQYPDHKDSVKELFGDSDNPLTQAHVFATSISTPGEDGSFVEFYNQAKDMLRVFHLEYRRSVVRKYLRTQDGGFSLVTDEDIQAAEQLSDIAGVDFDLDIVEVDEHDIMWIDFIKHKVLFNDKQPIPIEGFSITPMVATRNRRTGAAHGLVKDILSPQMEVNKRYSHTLSLLLQQQQPGTIIEESAVENVAEFERRSKTPGATRVVRDNALTAGKIQLVTAPQLPDGSSRMGEAALKLADLIAGKQLDQADGPRGVEAAQTAMLKVRQSQMRKLRARNNYRSYQYDIATKLTQIYMSPLISDEQLVEMLGGDGVFVVQGDGIVELGPDRQPIAKASIRQLRDLKWRIELDIGTAKGSERMMLLESLTTLASAGVPIQPEEWIRAAVTGADQQHRMIVSAKQMQKQASEQQEKQLQLLIKEKTKELEIKQAGQQEKTRHAFQLEDQARQDSLRDFVADLIGTYEKADNSEKQFILRQLQSAGTPNTGG